MQNIKRNRAILATTLVTLTLIFVYQQTNAAGSKNDQPKSVAWYTANIKTAQQINKECHSTNDAVFETNQDCINALHALEISFGVNH
jgi:hypothetical protein